MAHPLETQLWQDAVLVTAGVYEKVQMLRACPLALVQDTLQQPVEQALMELIVLAVQREYLVAAVGLMGRYDLPGDAVLLRHKDIPFREVLPQPTAVPVHLRVKFLKRH